MNIFEGKQVKQTGQEQKDPGLPDKKSTGKGAAQKKLIKIFCEKIDNDAEHDTVHPDKKDDNLKNLHRALLHIIELNHRFRPFLLHYLGSSPLKFVTPCQYPTISLSVIIWQ